MKFVKSIDGEYINLSHVLWFYSDQFVDGYGKDYWTIEAVVNSENMQTFTLINFDDKDVANKWLDTFVKENGLV